MRLITRLELVQENFIQIKSQDSERLQLVQVTDPHLFGKKKSELLGVNTDASFAEAIKHINSEKIKPDMLLATGDLSQDATADAYQRFSKYITSTKVPSFWLAGNHDHKLTMSEYIKGPNIYSEKCVDTDYWRIILLDSSVANKVYGYLDESQMTFLEEALDSSSGKNCLIALHHHPIPMGSDWIDKIGVHNADTFLKLIRKYSQVKGVIWGHVHQALDQCIDGIRFISTPSTSVQFKPKSDGFAAENEKPGYRTISLNRDGSIETKVHRVEPVGFKVDLNISGY